jgi:2-octaprenyl-6-methoxyphenol hydroxylase
LREGSGNFIMDAMIRRDVIVVGSGPAGLAAACLVAEAGVAASVIAPRSEGDDPRTVALMQPSMALLQHLGVWPTQLIEACAPLRRLRLIDDTGGPTKGPDLSFASTEIGVEEFGWNIPLARLIPALKARAAELGVEFIDAAVTGAESGAGTIDIRTEAQTFTARVAFAADGAQSLLREAAGIGVNRWNYDQSALVTSFEHSGPHGDTSTEYHRTAGPFTTVPLPGNRSSLVWMERPERAAELAGMSDRNLAMEIQLACHGDLGLVSNIGPRRIFPMRGLAARAFAGKRVLLIGEAAHVVPPIGAQGLNMSLRDAAHAAELVCDALSAGEDPAGRHVETDYQLARRADVMSRQAIIDTTNRSLLARSELYGVARNMGLYAIDALPALRRIVMQGGIGPSRGLPRAMLG